MSLINLSVEHGRTLDEARKVLEVVVTQVRGRFGPMVQQVDWSAERDAVKLAGIGFWVDLKVDARQVHLAGDIPVLGGLLGSPMVTGLKQIVTQAFKKSLPGGK